MSLQDKLDAARKLVEEHIKVLDLKTVPYIKEGCNTSESYFSVDSFIQKIKLAGGTNEERLKSLSYEDILAAMPEINGMKPIALAKDIAKVFRGKEEVKSENEPRPVSAKKAERMTLRELVEAYDPSDYSNPVGKRLSEISKNEKFIVFLTGHTVDVETTVKLLQEVKQGYQGRDEIDGKEVHRIGEVPDNFVDENPLYKNRPLRPDGTCDQTGRSWNGVPMNVRQLVRIAIETGELAVSFEQAHNILDTVVDEKGWDKLSHRYRKAVIEFKKREGFGEFA